MKESTYILIYYILIIIGLGICTLIILEKLEADKIEIKQSIENYHNCELEKQIEELTAKKNTLYLIALEKGKKKPNRAYLDSLEVDYGLR